MFVEIKGEGGALGGGETKGRHNGDEGLRERASCAEGKNKDAVARFGDAIGGGVPS
jgi:hypothetical protein